MHTVHSSVGSFCTIMCNVHTTVSMYSKMIHRMLQLFMQVPAMLGFRSPSFTFTFKRAHNKWHAHFHQVRYCQDKPNSTVEDNGMFCKLNSINCRHDSNYPDSNMANCQVCFIMSLVMFAMLGTLCFKLCFDRLRLVTNCVIHIKASISY